jgi:hypothetical protein
VRVDREIMMSNENREAPAEPGLLCLVAIEVIFHQRVFIPE